MHFTFPNRMYAIPGPFNNILAMPYILHILAFFSPSNGYIYIIHDNTKGKKCVGEREREKTECKRIYVCVTCIVVAHSSYDFFKQVNFNFQCNSRLLVFSLSLSLHFRATIVQCTHIYHLNCDKDAVVVFVRYRFFYLSDL